jgi:signal transduction histidine kinase
MSAPHLPSAPYRQTALIGVLLVLLVGLFTWQSWRADRDDQLLHLRTVAELAERATDRYFLQQQLALGELAAQLVEDNGLSDPWQAHQLLLAFKNRHSELEGMHLLALDGRYLASSATPHVETLPAVNQQRNFATIVAALRFEQPLVLARPLRGPSSQRWILPLRYAVRDARGEPQAFLVAAAPVELVQSFWSDAPVVRNAALALLRDDGYLINRYPLPVGARDDDVYSTPRTGTLVNFLRENSYPRRGTVVGTSSLVPSDTHVSVFVRLEHYPVTLSVTMPQKRMVQNWWERAAAPLLLMTALAALGLLVFHQLGRREHAWALERLLAEQRLRDSEAFLQRTGQAARIGGWTIDVATRAVRGSAGLFRILEIGEQERLDIPRVLSFFAPEGRGTMQAALDGAMADGMPWDLELPFVSARGRTLWVRVVGEAECDDGRPVRLVGALQDVTEYRQRRLELQQEQALRQSAEQQAQTLDALLAERSQMLDVLAHEVRQPLNNASAALQSASGALAEVGAGPVAHRLSRAHAVLSQVTGSLDNTLAVATQLARPGPVQREDTDIDTLVAVSVGDLPAEQRSRVIVERQTATRTVLADLGLVRLALRNLLVNALRHGPAATPVVVRLADSDEPLALIIDVIDHGPGIDAQLVPRLFERGVRGSGSGGHGLGLFLVRRVMEQHGGQVVLLKNTPGEVVFRLVLAQTADD